MSRETAKKKNHEGDWSYQTLTHDIKLLSLRQCDIGTWVNKQTSEIKWKVQKKTPVHKKIKHMIKVTSHNTKSKMYFLMKSAKITVTLEKIKLSHFPTPYTKQ